MALDPTITVGNLLTLLAIIGTGAWYLFTMFQDVRDLKRRFDALKGELQEIRRDVHECREALRYLGSPYSRR